MFGEGSPGSHATTPVHEKLLANGESVPLANNHLFRRKRKPRTHAKNIL